MGNDFVTLIFEKPYETNNTCADKTMSTQSHETTPYMLDSEQRAILMMNSQLALIQQINKGATPQNLAEQ